MVDDFIRNFLIKVGMTRTLDSFNTEWYELQAKGRLGEEYITKVPDIYLRNEELDEQARFTTSDISRVQPARQYLACSRMVVPIDRLTFTY